jgi:para-nitrobenzyl esterase
MSLFREPDRRTLLAGVGAAALAPSDDAIVETASGKLRGARADGAYIFRGAPYGESTGGNRRFLPPGPVTPWTGVRDALTFGPRAPQLARRGAGPSEADGEDCLVLNVYTPALGQGRRPVMVWLHGGGFASGSGGADYDGRWLAAKRDVVVVTLNHRLNLFGFLDLSQAGEPYVYSANAGLLDIAQALEWVRANIGEFGGDPGCVTVFGQSGGGAKVSAVLAAPAGAGLIHRAIPESGAVLRSLTKDQSIELSHALFRQLGLSHGDVSPLKTAPAATLLEAMRALGSTGEPNSTRLNFGPCVDGQVLPGHPCDPDAPAVSADVPVMVGSTHDETRLFYVDEPGFAAMTDAQMRARLAPTMKTDAETVDRVVAAFRAVAPDLAPPDLFLEITTQYMFTRNSELTAERKAVQGGAPAYLYRIDWVSPGPIGARIRAAHAVEIPLVFELPGPHRLVDDTPERRQMADLMSEVWTRFARTGDPNGPGLPNWPAFEARRRPTMIFDAQCRVVADPERRIRAAWPVLPEFHP